MTSKANDKANDKEPDWNALINPTFMYSINVTDIYDGDTITCQIDLGFSLDLKKQKIRLFGINAPERKGKERIQGLISRDVLNSWIQGKKVTLCTIKKSDKDPHTDELKGKYGRWLGILMCEGENLNKKMVDMGYAVYRKY